jgi:allophanate hydrolase
MLPTEPAAAAGPVATALAAAVPPATMPFATWRAATFGSADLADPSDPTQLTALATRLHALRDSMSRAGAPVYLHVIDAAGLEAQLAALHTRAAACADAAERAARLPLLGVPFVIKDNIDIAGVPTTAACPAFAYTPARHASVVQRLLGAGGLWLAKTNLDQFATGLVGTRSPHGAPASVAAADRVSGGSSSGSAVAVARGDVPFALGTDTAGSGRVPAAFNGLVGLKPTPGRVSTAGIVPACRSLDCVSVFATTVADAAAVLGVIEGEDPADPFSHFVPGPARLPATLRLGVPASMPLLADGYSAAWSAACERARAAGHTLVPIDFAPLAEVAALLYEGPWVAERHLVAGPLLAREPSALDPVVARVIGRAAGFDAGAAFAAQYRLRELAQRAAALWAQCDLLLVPSAPRHPTFAEVAADPVGVNAELGTFTNFVNLLGWCALALPAGRTAAGLPFGVTFIGAAGLDAALARFGLSWTGEPAPVASSAWPRSAPTLPLAVVGAHLTGLPLNGQLTERGAVLRECTRTALLYRLYALPGTTPPKPGLVRVGAGGHAVEVEVWELPLDQVGSFLALVPSPLSLGTLQLSGGRSVHGFLCEPLALEGATDISRHGGWRAYLAFLAAR